MTVDQAATWLGLIYLLGFLLVVGILVLVGVSWLIEALGIRFREWRRRRSRRLR